MNRKVLSVLLIFMLVFSVVAPAFAADGEADLVVSAGKVTAAEGTAVVPLTIEKNAGFALFSISVSYDPTALQFDGLTKTNDALTVTAENPQAGIVNIMVEEPNFVNYTETGAFADVAFTVLAVPEATTEYAVALSYPEKDAALDENIENVAISVVDGAVTVEVTTTEPDPEEPPVVDPTYDVVVENGTGDGSYKVGETVTIKADAAAKGYVFAGWVGNVEFADAAAAETTFVMPEGAVEVEATYAVDADYAWAIDVTRGSATVGDTEVTAAKAGTEVTITADNADKFKSWTAKGVELTKEQSTTSSFILVMPAADVELTAVNKSTGGGGGGGAFVGPSTPTKEVTKTIVMTIGDKNVKVDDGSVACDVAPLIVDNRTYTPSRFVAEQLGAKVTWDEAKQLVTITSADGKTVIELTIGSKVAKVNSEAVEMDAAAFIKDGRTYTPARFVAEQLGGEVTWDEATRQVTIKQFKA